MLDTAEWPGCGYRLRTQPASRQMCFLVTYRAVGAMYRASGPSWLLPWSHQRHAFLVTVIHTIIDQEETFLTPTKVEKGPCLLYRHSVYSDYLVPLKQALKHRYTWDRRTGVHCEERKTDLVLKLLPSSLRVKC